MKYYLFLLIIVLAFSSCSKDAKKDNNSTEADPVLGGGNPVDPTASLTRVQNEIFTPHCSGIGCHDQLGRQENLILLSGQAFSSTVNAPATEDPSLKRVLPKDPANSYLYRKIIGAGITGDRMPQGGPYLTDAQTKLLRDWILRDVPDN